MGSDKRNTGWKLESMVRGEKLFLVIAVRIVSTKDLAAAVFGLFS